MSVYNGGLRAGLIAACAAMLLACVHLLAMHGTAVAQCPPVFADGEPGQGIKGTANCAINFDPDGAGPSPSLLIVGGRELELPGLLKCALLAYDGVRWSRLDTTSSLAGAGYFTINAMTVLNGELIVAGFFSSIAGVPATNIAAWNGTQWRALGAGLPGTCRSLGVFQGALYAGLSFVSPQALLRWNGSAWSSPTVASFSGVGGISINALETVGTSLYVGGLFDGAGGKKINNLARFDGSNYFTAGSPDGEVLSLAQYSGSDAASQRLFVGGAFANIGGVAAPRVASFAPSTGAWSSVSPAVSATWRNCKGIFVRSGRNSSYDLSVVAGTGSSIFPTTTGMQLVGGVWTSQGIEQLAAWSLFAGRYVAVGSMEGSRVQWLDAGVWRGFGDGLYGVVNDVLPVNDTLIAISALRPDALDTQSSGAWRIMSRPLAGGSWTPFGEFNRRANTIERAANGDLLVGGYFSQVNGAALRLVARWNGSTWSQVGTFVSGSITDLLTEPSGDIIAGGSFTLTGIAEPVTVARWNGASWSRIGSAFNGPVYRLERMPNGDLIAAGEFTIAGGVPVSNIARWDGTQWTSMGPGFNGGVYALGVGNDGRLIAGGYFAKSGTLSVNSIARWNGATWESLGSGVALGVDCLAFQPTGELIVGGGIYSAGGIDVNAIAQWNGTEWSALGQGMDDSVLDLAVLPDGDVIACGAFFTAGSKPSAYITRFSPGESGPTISTQPVPQATCSAGSASFSVVAEGTGLFTYQWRRGGVPIDVVTMPSAATATLSLSNVAPVDVNSYDCAVTDSCGSTVSNPAALTICAADFDCDGFITFEDFDSFVNAFEVGLASADFTGDGFLTFEDFDAFVAAFEGGC